MTQSRHSYELELMRQCRFWHKADMTTAFGDVRCQLLKQKVTKNSRAVMKQREQAEILKEGTTPAI